MNAFVGCDLSLAHAGVTILNEEGNLLKWLYLTPTKKYVFDVYNGTIETFFSPKRETGEDKLTFHHRRLLTMSHFAFSCCGFINLHSTTAFVGVEDYAFGAGNRSSNSLCQIAEATSVFKYILFSNLQNVKIRLYDPNSIKMFATGRGKAVEKQDMIEAVKETSSGNLEIPEETYSVKKSGEFDGPGTDLADSYFIARLLFMEKLCRDGNFDYRELDEGKRRVFLRTTKAHPVNILDAPYGEWPDD